MPPPNKDRNNSRARPDSAQTAEKAAVMVDKGASHMAISYRRGLGSSTPSSEENVCSLITS
ncbi:MAG: hypothetical protein ACOX55_12190 [Christensenellales bacterium]